LLDFEKAIAFSSGDANPFVNRGEGDLFQRAQPVGRLAEAIDDYSRAISIDSNNDIFHRCKAHACLKMGRLEEAIESFSDAFRQTYLDRGQTHEKLGRNEEAQLDLLSASKLPRYPKRKR